MASDSGPNGTDENADPICVVGMACRLPGDVRSPCELWDFISNNRSAQGPVPAQRFNINGFHHVDNDRAGVMSANGGYFLKDDVREFDNKFFGINNLEATYMDPHQRKLLEVVYECFEDAGLSMDEVSGTNTGVYVGNFTVDFTNMHFRDPDYLHRYSSTGSNMAIISNRVSHVFNLQGPSLSLNTACSSSLYCLHMALGGIMNGDCDTAVVAGVNLILSPEQHLETMKGGVLSPSSVCHTFDESADGYGRAEAVNAVYLKRLSSAMNDRDHIYGIIRATAVNSNGRTPGIAQPSVDQQETLINKAYAHARLNFSDTDYVECHGTGTAVGDRIEIEALGRCFAPRKGNPLLIGSVKTNFGHSEAASGLTSLMKVLLAFGHEQVPPTFGLKKLNPELRLGFFNMQVVTELVPWPRAIRRASINSFGYGGANSHAIIESLDSYLGRAQLQEGPECDRTDAMFVLPISAKSKGSLEERARQIIELVQGTSVPLSNLAQTCAHEATKFKIRNFLLAEKGRCLDTKIDRNIRSDLISPLRIAFVFNGQGTQYEGMGRTLQAQSPVFLSTIRKLDMALQNLPSEVAPRWTLEDAIGQQNPEGCLNQPIYSQSLCTAIQVGLVDVLKSWGISPSVSIGHSSGEIAAAYAAGLLTASQSIAIAYLRGYAVSRAKTSGAMIAAGIEPEFAEQLIATLNLQDEVCIACYNAPGNVTISGGQEAIALLFSEIQSFKKPVRRLETGDRAYHSRFMLDVGAEYETLISPLFEEESPEEMPAITMYSTVGGGYDQDTALVERARTARYWRHNLENPVRFNSALQSLLARGDYHLIEIGPHHALRGPIQQIQAQTSKGHLPYSSTLTRNQNDDFSLKRLAGIMHSHGHTLNWSEVNLVAKEILLLRNMPHYPWDYQDKLLWHEPRASVDLRDRRYVRHELLGSQQLAGSGIHLGWRNILRLREIPWLYDHRLESQIVFPAAGYLAMALEAMCQARGLQGRPSGIGFEFRNVSINAALVIEANDDVESRDTELHTTLTRHRISTATSSSEWHDFTISSWVEGTATMHCTGKIRLGETVQPKAIVNVSGPIAYETSFMKSWYDKLEEEGLSFGPYFRSITELSVEKNSQQDSHAVATTSLQRHDALGTPYHLHPIDIDAGFQAAIFGGSGGNITSLRAYLPVFIAECRIRILKEYPTDAMIHTRAAKTSASTCTTAFTMRGPDSALILDMKGIRMSQYTGKRSWDPDNRNEMDLQRHPCLRIRWKPDIMRLYSSRSEHIDEYVNDYLSRQTQDVADDKTGAMIGAVLDLAGHKFPGMRILELGYRSNSRTKQWQGLLDMGSAFPRCREWRFGRILETGDIEVDDSDTFDVVLIPGDFRRVCLVLTLPCQYAESSQSWLSAPSKVLAMVNDRGIVISRKSNEAMTALSNTRFKTIDIGNNIIMITRHDNPRPSKPREVLVIYRELSTTIQAIVDPLTSYLEGDAGISKVSSATLAEIASCPIAEDTICLSLLELEQEFLVSMSSDAMDSLRIITNKVQDLVWITGTGLLKKSNPRLTMSNGLSRALMLEQPSLRFVVFDVGPRSDFEQDIKTTCRNVLQVFVPQSDVDDKEFIQSNGLLFVSRFYPDHNLNSLFRRRMWSQDPRHLVPVTLKSAHPARLAFGKPGVTDSIHFKQICSVPQELPPGYVEVHVKAVSLNAKDLYVASGRVETHDATLSCEFAGVVSATASDVQGIQPGDHVVAMLPNHCTTIERVPAWTLCKLFPEEEFTVMSTIPVAYSTALYALRDRAQLRRGESVLIQAGTGGLGMAAIDVAQKIGAIIFATVGSYAKKRFLMSHFGLPASHIFSSRDNSFVEGIEKMTAGRGVDVILNSLTGDLMHAAWSCIADFGTFVEVGKRELLDAGNLDMAVFQRNATFTAFDLSELFFNGGEHHTKVYTQLLQDAVEWYRSRQTRPGPIKVYDVADMIKAYHYFSSGDRVGKVVVSFENAKSKIQVSEPYYRSIFDPKKAYILVGCLGGLGRSLSRWMASRGARHLVFLGRSGCDMPNARKLIRLLGEDGVDAKVLKGDVTSFDDVQKAVRVCASIGNGIGGVIHAAMGLRESLFSRMTHDAWHQGIDAKWSGAWNLHTALEGHDEALDFFLLTSSVSGTVGIATEANYCASNGFLDAFARWRREQGKPAVSVGLGMISGVGYLHENPDIERILLRKGIYPITEEEFLQVVDFALTTGTQDDPGEAHILTGMESLGFKNLMAKGFDVNNLPMLDPRSCILAEALAAEQSELGERHSGTQGRFADSTAIWAKELPATMDSGILLAESDADSLRDAVLRIVRKQFSNLTLTTLNQIDDKKSFAEFGVDSMIASEFRTWLWTALKVDIPFLDLLSATQSLSSLAVTVETKLKKI